MTKHSVYELLADLKAKDLERNQFNYLVESTFKIAKSYIYHNRTKLINICTEEKNMQDIAIDAISSMFIKNGDQRFPICKSFEEWDPVIRSEEEALYFLNKLTACRVEQHISKCLKESDPVFAKILDSLNYVIKKHSFTKYRILGQVFIINNCEVSTNKKLVTYEDLVNIPSNYFCDNDKIFDRIFKYLENNTDFMPAIPLNALATRIKNLQVVEFNTASESNTIESLMFVNEIVQKGLKLTISKLNSSYLEKGKLTESETEAFEATLEDMAQDLIAGGVNNGLIKYLSKHMQNLSIDVYKNKYHNTLEYLLKIMKNIIKQEIMLQKKIPA